MQSKALTLGTAIANLFIGGCIVGRGGYVPLGIMVAVVGAMGAIYAYRSIRA